MPADHERQGAFELYDIRVEVVGCQPGKSMVCNHPIGSYFEVSGEELSLPPGQSFPIYPLAALLPLIPAKQRETHANDWMTTDTLIACPDPNCGGLFEIKRVRKRTFHHGDVTVVPLREE
ncbi:MAG: TIGR04076 family protein [Chloroflexi bacterium]|nr:TIGR04076 family protein [Chloroflexota bacterium]